MAVLTSSLRDVERRQEGTTRVCGVPVIPNMVLGVPSKAKGSLDSWSSTHRPCPVWRSGDRARVPMGPGSWTPHTSTLPR